MIRKRLALPAAIAGLLVFLLNLLAEWLINGRLVAADYYISLVAAVLTALVIFLLFGLRGRGGK
jgi:uncharacterized membrane protein